MSALEPVHYRLIFESSVIGEYVLSRDLTILDVNRAFLKASGRRRDELVGFALFDVFPEDPRDPGPSGVSALRRSLQNVLETGRADALALQRYPIPVRQPDGTTRFDERYWSAYNTPIFDEQGQLVCISHSTIDVTDLHVARNAALQDGDDTRLQHLEAGLYSRAQTLQQVNHALQAERARLRHLFEHAPGFVFFTRGPDHVIEQANNAFNQLVDNRPVLGRTVREAFPDVQGQGFFDRLDDVLRTGEPYIGRGRLLLLRYADEPDPVERYIDVVFQPIVDEQGQVIGACVQGVDITERKQAEAQLRRHGQRQAFQLALMDRIRNLDDAHEIVAAACAMLGRRLDVARVFYSEIDDAGHGFYVPRDWTHPDLGLPSIAGLRRQLDDFGPQAVGLLRSGQVMRVDDVRTDPLTCSHAQAYEAYGVRSYLTVPLIKAGKMTIALTLQHTQPYHWSADDVRISQDTAERTWSAAEKAAAQAELQEANRRKDEFLAMLAHELRNPLAPISAAAHLIETGRLDAARLKQASQVISRQVRHMTALVDDLLDVSRVTRGLVKLDNAPQDMRAIVASAVEQVRPLIESRRHELSLDLPTVPVTVLGDWKRLVQILANLLNNAAKYTPPQGRLQLMLKLQDQQVLVQMQDNGIGIALELQPRVFELFTQAEQSFDRSHGGLGLGLALVKTLVELHGGSVSCRSDGPGQGSCFTVRLPRLEHPQAVRPELRRRA